MAPRATKEFDEYSTRIAVKVRGVRARPERPHLLEIVDGPGKGRQFRLEGHHYDLGRGARASLQLESDEVSRLHATLSRADGEYTIEDAGSRNGIVLNGVKVHGALLRDGDEVQLGDVVLRYLEGT